MTIAVINKIIKNMKTIPPDGALPPRRDLTAGAAEAATA
jgi:hypothetical protein